MSIPTWHLQAACRPGTGISPDMFFPELGDRATRAAAQRICAECPVKSQCAAYARRYGPFFGIWGGEYQSLSEARNNYHSPAPRARHTGAEPRTHATHVFPGDTIEDLEAW